MPWPGRRRRTECHRGLRVVIGDPLEPADMKTVNVQCGHCGKLMAVSTEHLGARVSCPHCQGVVEAPAEAPAASSPPTNDSPEIRVPLTDSPESIFASAETEATEDIFGTQQRAT